MQNKNPHSALRTQHVPMNISLTAVPHIPDVQPGDNVAELILTALAEANLALQDGDVLAIAQKIVSKAEGRLVHLAEVEPGPRALAVAAQTDKDPRVVELILRESDEISRLKPGVLVVRHKLGFTSANAGIDRSNVAADGDTAVLLLPVNPDASAAAVRQTIHARLGVTVGVKNLLDKDPPFSAAYDTNTGAGSSWEPRVADPRGRAFTFTVDYKFF